MLPCLIASVAAGQSGARNGMYEGCVSQCKSNESGADQECKNQYSEKIGMIENDRLIGADEKEQEKRDQKVALKSCLAGNQNPESLAAFKRCFDSCGPAPSASEDTATYCRKYASVPERACINDTHDAAQCHSNYLNDFQACLRSNARNY
jgi:hypothetical protein